MSGIRYTFQRIGSKYEGDGVAFCAKRPIQKPNLMLRQSCAAAFKYPIDASTVLIGQWLKKIAEGDEQMMFYMSNNISRALYDFNNTPKSKERQIIIYTLDYLKDNVLIAEVDAELTIRNNYYDIDAGRIINKASYFKGEISFNSKSSWLYKAITTIKDI